MTIEVQNTADVRASDSPRCRACGAQLTTTFLDLGSAPASNAYLRAADLERAEAFFPLHAYVCGGCFLVQLQAFQTPAEIFSDYAYFSSFSSSWLEHGARYADAICAREHLGADDLIIEIASNDGYLLRHFAERGMRVVGIEPAANVARVAVEAGIPTIVSFFGKECARQLRAENYAPRLLVANNVLAHVPDVHDFVAGLAIMLEGDALATIEVPHLLRLIESCQFDTIYHEHFSYFSLLALEPIFAAHGLCVVDVEELTTHGGSLRLYVRSGARAVPSARVEAIRQSERCAKLGDIATYQTFTTTVVRNKRRALGFLLAAQGRGEIVAAYGAPAKGNTYFNYCGIRKDLVAFAVDRSPHKQGLFLPGSRIPVFHPDELRERRPAYVLIMPWNLTDEIVEQVGYIRDWGGRFVTAIPDLVVHS
jgi:hypothetical protein